MKNPDHTDANPSRELTLRFVVLMSLGFGGGSLVALGVFFWVGSFQFVELGFGPATILVWDGLLSLVFFGQHSAMIRRGFRVRSQRLIPPHLYAAVYSVASGTVLWVVVVLWQRSPVVIWAVEPPWSWLLRSGFFVAILGFVAGTRALHGFDGFGLRPIRDHLRGRERPTAPLTVEGPYRWVRHPLYTCVLVMIWSCPVVTADRLLFNLLWTGWMVVGTILEERDLVRDFGDDYRAYQAAVPMLIPWTLRPRWP